MNDFERLILAHLNDEASEDETKELFEWIKKDGENAKEFAKYSLIHAQLRGQLSGERLVRETLAKTNGISSANQPTTDRETRRSGRPYVRLATVVSLAAALLIAIGMMFIQSRRDATRKGTPSQVAFLTIAQCVDMVWQDNEAPDVGSRFGATSFAFIQGILTLEFDSGVEVAIEGPAEFEILSLNETRLASGLLSATVPPGAEGFRVDTPSAKVIDLGTAFGIEQSKNGQSKVSVFDGEVEVVTQNENRTRLLTEGESIQLDSDGRMNEVDFETRRFEKLWPTSSGIAGSSGAFRFAPRWPRRLNRVQSDKDIIVLPEGYPKKLMEPCSVDISVPGSCSTIADLSSDEIPTGRRVRSFLLQFNPVHPIGPNSPPNVEMIEGSISFHRPVLGLIVQGNSLRASDGRFSWRGGRVRQRRRGLEFNSRSIRRNDVVTLSDDRKTVSISLVASGRHSDHVRIIVDAELNSDDSERP